MPNTEAAQRLIPEELAPVIAQGMLNLASTLDETSWTYCRSVLLATAALTNEKYDTWALNEAWKGQS